MKTMIRLALAAALAALAAPALATQALSSFNVTATVPATCQVTAGTADLAFASYDPTGAVVTQGQTTIAFHCTKNTPWKVTLGLGNNSGSAVGTSRAMKDAGSGDFLSYELYTDAGHTNPWSSNPAAVAPLVATGSGSGTGGNSVNVYGLVPAGQYPTPSAGYTDSVQIVVNY
jgi:spore coat protein U-like protein